MLIPIRDHNPYRHFPIVTIGLIAANVVVFILTLGGGGLQPSDSTVYQYGAVPCDVLHRCSALNPAVLRILDSRPPFLSLITSMFMHGGLLHIAGNMLFLWVFGNNVEDKLGRIRFVAFYFVCGLAAAYGHIITDANSVIPIVGASGAISGVLGAYLVLFPKARVVSLVPILFFFTTIVTPAWVVLTLWFVFQIFSGVVGLGFGQESGGGGVAFFAHIGGFIAGVLLVKPFMIGRENERSLQDWVR